MKYYEGHEQEYQRRLQAGHVAWDAGAYEAFDMLPWLRECLAVTSFDALVPRALDLGCGTGALAVFLAQQGFDVMGVDISFTAIKEARKQAAQRKVQVDYSVADICALTLPEDSFDLITDNHFLHCIVFEDERMQVLAGIHALLKPGGQYWIETMVGHPAMKSCPEWNMDADGITWADLGDGETIEGCKTAAGKNWLPIRRIRLNSPMLAGEIQQAGFEILWQETLPPKDEKDTGSFRARCVKK